MSKFITYFNNLNKIEKKNFNVDYTEEKKIIYIYIVVACILLKPINFNTFFIIKAITSFNWLIVPSNNHLSYHKFIENIGKKFKTLVFFIFNININKII